MPWGMASCQEFSIGPCGWQIGTQQWHIQLGADERKCVLLGPSLFMSSLGDDRWLDKEAIATEWSS